MCGIFGTVSVRELTDKNTNKTQNYGAEEAMARVVDGLKRLEYRGYDSWGIAASIAKDKVISNPSKVLHSNTILLEKEVGAIGDVVFKEYPNSTAAIGHTRWATHGGVTTSNAHPHQSTDGSFAVVHNGVIENHNALRKHLPKVEYVSETDTEVFVRLVERNVTDGMALSEAICDAFDATEGRNAFVVLTQDGDIFSIRRGSPLILGRNRSDHSISDSVLISSDMVSLAADAKEWSVLQENELYHLHAGSVKKGSVNWQKLSQEAFQLDKAGYASFMEKEIYEQPAILSQFHERMQELSGDIIKRIKGARRVFIVGAGSASYASEFIALQLRAVGVDAIAVSSNEYHSWPLVASQEDVIVAVSQSGETADTIEVIEEFRKQKCTVLGLVNAAGSTLAREADLWVPLSVGPEIGVASTKALLAMMSWGQWLAAELRKDGGLPVEAFSEWMQEGVARDWAAAQMLSLKLNEPLYILGTGEAYPIALEAALKLKEIGYLHVEAISTGSLKHGVLALVEDGTQLMVLDSGTAVDAIATSEIGARGGVVTAILRDPELGEWGWWGQLVRIQLLALEIAYSQKRNPDKPRNLAKSVTVA